MPLIPTFSFGSPIDVSQLFQPLPLQGFSMDTASRSKRWASNLFLLSTWILYGIYILFFVHWIWGSTHWYSSKKISVKRLHYLVWIAFDYWTITNQFPKQCLKNVVVSVKMDLWTEYAYNKIQLLGGDKMGAKGIVPDTRTIYWVLWIACGKGKIPNN